MAGFMSGFAQGFSRERTAIQDRNFKAEQAEKDRIAAESRLKTQYAMDFDNKVNLAKEQSRMANDQVFKDTKEWYDSTTPYELESVEYLDGLQKAVGQARAHGGIGKKLEYDQEERKIQNAKENKIKPEMIVPGLMGYRTSNGVFHLDGRPMVQKDIDEQLSKNSDRKLESQIEYDESKKINDDFRESKEQDFETMNNYNTLIGNIENADTGALADLGYELSRYAKSFGIQVDEDVLTARGQLKIAKMKALVGAISKYPGAMSNKEMTEFVKSVPSETQEPTSNRYIANAAYAMANRREYIRLTTNKLLATGQANSSAEAVRMIDYAMEDKTSEYYLPFISEGPNQVIDERTGTPLFYAVFKNDVRQVRPEMTEEEIKKQWMAKHAAK